MSSGVKVLLMMKKMKLKEAIKRGFVRKNDKGVWVLTGRGNKFKQGGSTRPDRILKLIGKR